MTPTAAPSFSPKQRSTALPGCRWRRAQRDGRTRADVRDSGPDEAGPRIAQRRWASHRRHCSGRRRHSRVSSLLLCGLPCAHGRSERPCCIRLSPQRAQARRASRARWATQRRPRRGHHHSYVQNDPINRTDPSGFWSWSDPGVDVTAWAMFVVGAAAIAGPGVAAFRGPGAASAVGSVAMGGVEHDVPGGAGPGAGGDEPRGERTGLN